jgi:hypothetical protein
MGRLGQHADNGDVGHGPVRALPADLGDQDLLSLSLRFEIVCDEAKIKVGAVGHAETGIARGGSGEGGEALRGKVGDEGEIGLADLDGCGGRGEANDGDQRCTQTGQANAPAESTEASGGSFLARMKGPGRVSAHRSDLAEHDVHRAEDRRHIGQLVARHM